MRKLNMWTWTAALALVAYGLPASAETLYRWTGPDGSVSYTDDAKRIPERYRGAAQSIQTGGLAGYKHYSPQKEEASAPPETMARLEKRIESLRALNRELDREAFVAEAPRATVAPSAGGSEAYVRVGRDLTMRVPETAPDEGPVVVEDVRVLPSGGAVTHHDTVVRQGGRTLLVVVGDRQSFGAGPFANQGVFDLGDDEYINEQELLGQHPLWNDGE